MAASPKFASGKYAWGICDICGIRAKLHSLKGTTVMGKPTGLLVCETDWDPDHPQNFLPMAVQNDPQALRQARPDTGLEASRQLFPPGNWINGQPPSALMEEAAALVIRAEHLRQRALFRLEEEAQRTRRRSF